MRNRTAIQIAIDTIRDTANSYPEGNLEKGVLNAVVNKVLTPLLEIEKTQVTTAYKNGYRKHVSGSRCNLDKALNDLSEENYKETYR
jgi:hypothetical protein